MVRRTRHAPIAVPVVVAAALVLSRAVSFVALGPFLTRRSATVLRATATAAPPGTNFRKKAITYSDVDVEQFYAESINGTGGAPLGIERDLITQYFGNGDVLGNGDHTAALQTLKERMAQGDDFVGEDDGKGWIWLVADVQMSGLTLELRKSTPLGKRPLFVAKQDNVDELFEKVNWKLARHRINEILGVRDFKGRKA